MNHKSLLAITLYAAFTTIIFYLTIFGDIDVFNGLLVMAPILPWSLLAPFGQMSQIVFFGYLPLYVLNASLIYRYAAKKKPVNIPIMALVVAVSTVPWTSIVFYDAATCTEKLCGLTAVLGGVPGLFMANLLIEGGSEKEVLNYVLATVFNVISYFLIVWGVGSVLLKNKMKKTGSRKKIY